MTDVRKILQQVGAQESQLQSARFLAPCVAGGQVRARVSGLVYSFVPRPRNFEGWAIFQPQDAKRASVSETPSLQQISQYLRLLRPLRVRLAVPLQGRTWLCYPCNESDARQQVGAARPMPLHLVSEGIAFEQAVARCDGGTLWFEEVDRRANPRDADHLRDALRRVAEPASLRWKGLTPEMRTTYDLAAQQALEFQEMMRQRREEGQLREALQRGGATLHQYTDRGDQWLVEWTTADGNRHTSAIRKQDLTVLSAGVCLAGRDRDFDLQSLVGVMEGAGEDWYD